MQEKLQIDSLIALGQAHFEALTDNAKLEISKATIMLDINRKTYALIYNRFSIQTDSASDDDSLEPLIKKLTEQLSDSQAWINLLSATYAATAWLIFEQADQTATDIRKMLAAAAVAHD